MPDNDKAGPSVPESRAVAKKRRRLSAVWIIPIVAAAVGAWIAVTDILSRGPTITIVFDTAEGLEAGKTGIHYNGVPIGTLTEIHLTKDREKVKATAAMVAGTEDLLVEGTRFWIVRPRISGAEVSGLGTLLSGAFIGVEIGTAKTAKRDFVALEKPPVVTGDVPGRFFVLSTNNLGSLDYGTPIYFRRLKVGEVSSYELSDDGKSLEVKVFVNAPYDQYVNPETRFWQASGIDVSLSAAGLQVQTQSLLSILIGGIAFETLPSAKVVPPADENARFTLFPDRAEAFQRPRGKPDEFVLVFEQSVRGLAVGAPVEFLGVGVGEVVDIKIKYDPESIDVSVPVTVRVYRELLGIQVEGETEEARRHRIDTLVERGYRSQLRTGSLLTGSLFVAMDFFPQASPAKVDWAVRPPQLPTVARGLDSIEDEVRSLLAKIETIPFKEMGDDAAKTLEQLDQTVAHARKLVDSANDLIQPDSLLVSDLDNTLQEVSRAARALRMLANYLERHPEALLRGKSGEAN